MQDYRRKSSRMAAQNGHMQVVMELMKYNYFSLPSFFSFSFHSFLWLNISFKGWKIKSSGRKELCCVQSLHEWSFGYSSSTSSGCKANHSYSSFVDCAFSGC